MNWMAKVTLLLLGKTELYFERSNLLLCLCFFLVMHTDTGEKRSQCRNKSGGERKESAICKIIRNCSGGERERERS